MYIVFFSEIATFVYSYLESTLAGSNRVLFRIYSGKGGYTVFPQKGKFGWHCDTVYCTLLGDWMVYLTGWATSLIRFLYSRVWGY